MDRRELTPLQRILIVGAVCSLLGMGIAWYAMQSVLLGAGLGLLMVLGWVQAYELFRLPGESASIDERYRSAGPSLPILVSRKIGYRGEVDRSREVIGLHEDWLVITEVKVRREVPSEIFLEDGADELLHLPCYGTPRVYQFSEIHTVQAHRGRVFSPFVRFTGEAVEGSFRFQLPGEEGELFIVALQDCLGDKVSLTRDSHSEIRRKRSWRMLAICLGVDAFVVFTVWFAPPAGDAGPLSLVGDIRDAFGPTETMMGLAILLLLANSVMMSFAVRDPNGPRDSDYV